MSYIWTTVSLTDPSKQCVQGRPQASSPSGHPAPSRTYSQPVRCPRGLGGGSLQNTPLPADSDIFTVSLHSFGLRFSTELLVFNGATLKFARASRTMRESRLIFLEREGFQILGSKRVEERGGGWGIDQKEGRGRSQEAQWVTPGRDGASHSPPFGEG